MIRRKRKILFNLDFSDPTLKIYTPYLQISLVPGKKTFSGKHETKVMISIGRRYDEKKAREFFSKESDLKKKIVERMSKELNLTPEQIIKSQKQGKLKDLLIEAVAFQVKKLGIPVIIYRKKASYELYEYVKTRKPEEVLQIIYGMLIALGLAIKLFSADPELSLMRYKKLLEKNLEKFLNVGFRKDLSIEKHKSI